MPVAWFLLCEHPMNTLVALKQYDALCDELDAYMWEENAHLRSSGADEEILVSRKRGILEKLQGALAFLRESGPVRSTEHAASCEVRKRVLAKILKLLLLSRESEQLLLKNSLHAAPRTQSATPTPARLVNAYKSHKPTHAAATTQSEGTWVVW
jgi:hypothetical protein